MLADGMYTWQCPSHALPALCSLWPGFVLGLVFVVVVLVGWLIGLALVFWRFFIISVELTWSVLLKATLTFAILKQISLVNRLLMDLKIYWHMISCRTLAAGTLWEHDCPSCVPLVIPASDLCWEQEGEAGWAPLCFPVPHMAPRLMPCSTVMASADTRAVLTLLPRWEFTVWDWLSWLYWNGH